jgi:hypothetical protein
MFNTGICLFLLIVNVILHSTHADMCIHSFIYNHSPAHKLIRTGQWDLLYEQHRLHSRMFHTTTTTTTTTNEPNDNANGKLELDDFYDSEYLGEVTIGTPPQVRQIKMLNLYLCYTLQTFLVDMDTGSSDFWVSDVSCKSTACGLIFNF